LKKSNSKNRAGGRKKGKSSLERVQARKPKVSAPKKQNAPPAKPKRAAPKPKAAAKTPAVSQPKVHAISRPVERPLEVPKHAPPRLVPKPDSSPKPVHIFKPLPTHGLARPIEHKHDHAVHAVHEPASAEAHHIAPRTEHPAVPAYEPSIVPRPSHVHHAKPEEKREKNVLGGALIMLAIALVFLGLVYAYIHLNGGGLREPERSPVLYYLNFSTDKAAYRSNEFMNLTLLIVSQGYTGEGMAVFEGIPARGRSVLSVNHKFNLSVSLNRISVLFKTPSCNTCAGVKAGRYQINASVYFNNQLLKVIPTEVEIIQ